MELASINGIKNDFGVTKDGDVLLLSDDGVIALQNGKPPELLDATNTMPSSLAVDAQGNLLTIADGYLGMVTSSGEIIHSIPLPYDTVTLAPSSIPGAVYMFGGQGKGYRLYRILDDGTLQILFESSDPIISVADSQGEVYVPRPACYSGCARILPKSSSRHQMTTGGQSRPLLPPGTGLSS